MLYMWASHWHTNHASYMSQNMFCLWLSPSLCILRFLVSCCCFFLMSFLFLSFSLKPYVFRNEWLLCTAAAARSNLEPIRHISVTVSLLHSSCLLFYLHVMDIMHGGWYMVFYSTIDGHMAMSCLHCLNPTLRLTSGGTVVEVQCKSNYISHYMLIS